jgi:transketolase
MTFVTPSFVRAANTIRVLAVDAIQKSNSGHPGMPMGCADYALTLWHRHLRHNPADPKWLGRDRFVLSAGHGSMLLYSLFHLYGYPGMTMDELKQFRQMGSKTPGHPEYGHTEGVEVTTGPLGSGLASAVGMAIAAKQLMARTGLPLGDQKIYALSGDGCLMEGVSHEACALAGHLKLDNLILFYDSNSITIEGATSLAWSESVKMRFESYGWEAIEINGQDPAQCDAALVIAKQAGKPVIIIGTTTIGYGAPKLAGTHECHGAPLGAEETAAVKKAFGFDPAQSFVVDAETREFFATRRSELISAADAWDLQMLQFRQANPAAAELLDTLLASKIPANLEAELLAVIPEKTDATRSHGGFCIQKIAELIPSFYSGSADLSPSCKTNIKKIPAFSVAERSGRNLHYGVRELAMGMVANGQALYGGAIPACSTFLVFSDYMKPAIRLAALQGIKVVFVYTHDSIYVGEDGPTHEPIEQITMLRTIPGLTVLRPAEGIETAQAWAAALTIPGPVCILLARQNVPNFAKTATPAGSVAKGGYLLSEDAGADLTLVGSGSEAALALEAATVLRAEGKKVRVVSMPSMELFQKQPAAYRTALLPKGSRIVSIEAGSTVTWDRHVGDNGFSIGINTFGLSAPGAQVAAYFGLEKNAIAKTIKSHYGI